MGRIKDLTGQRFGRLTVIERDVERTSDSKGKKTFWKCQCDCGGVTCVRADSLKKGVILSCGCFRKEQAFAAAFKNLAGQKFGRLTVLNEFRLETDKRKTFWRCECDCGSLLEVRSDQLVGGFSQSCGCFRLERLRETMRKLPGESGFRRVLGSYRKHAKNRGYNWDLTEAQFRELTKQDCYYCGAAPSSKAYGHSKESSEAKLHSAYVYNGIDRVDNRGGYSVGNVVPCCSTCNRIKMDHSTEELFAGDSKMEGVRTHRSIGDRVQS